jgi:hypothetical protein
LQGLPSIEKEFENREWLFCASKKPDVADSSGDDVWSKMFFEFANHPFWETTDIVMSLWFAREAAKKHFRGDTGPNVW